MFESAARLCNDETFAALIAMLRQRLIRESSRDEDFELLSDFLLEVGFSGVRFWDLGAETIPGVNNSRTLYLLWQRSRVSTTQSEVKPGFEVPWSDATISQHSQIKPDIPALELRPTVGTHEDHAPWIEQLGLRGHSWVDVPLISGQHLVGVMAADWIGEPGALTPSLRSFLSLFGAMLGPDIREHASPLYEQMSALLRAYTETNSALDELMTKVVDLLSENLDVGSASLFRFDWTQQELRREYLKLASPRMYVAPPETFKVNVGLTGSAWADNKYRLALNVEDIRNARPDLIAEPSISFHSKVLGGPVRSVAYAHSGDSSRRYLIRLINHEHNPTLPLLREGRVLSRIQTTLGSVIDAKVALDRARATADVLERLRRKARSGDIADHILKHLKTIESLEAVFICAHREGDTRPYFVSGIPADIRSDVRAGILLDPAYKRAVTSSQNFLHSDRRPATPVDKVLGALTPSATRAGFFPFAAGITRGVIMVPLVWPGTNHRLWTLSPSEETRAFVSQLGSTLAQALEGEFIAVQADNALKALSLVGHEMVTPLASLTNVSQQAVLRAKKEVLRLSSQVPQSERRSGTWFDDIGSRVRDSAEALEAAVQLGNLVGRQKDGHLVGVRRLIRVRSILNRCIYNTKLQVNRGALYLPASGLDLRRPEGDGAEISAYLDSGLIEAALGNLYSNAVKYGAADKAVSLVFTCVSTLENILTIRIEGRSTAIPEEQQEAIFKAFVRAGGDQVLVARRGMGLGLYLAREIAKAHGGDVILASHKPVLDTVSEVPVFDTAFELTVKTNLPGGPYQYLVEGDDDGVG